MSKRAVIRTYRIRVAFAVVAGGVVSLAVIAAVGLPSAPYSSNAECLECHQGAAPGEFPTMPRVDFSAEPVDRVTACRKCHWRAAGEHPHTTMGCGCHVNPSPSAPGLSWPQVETPAGWFTAAESASATAETIHRIHLWADGNGGITMYNVKCGSCHARAACSACHTGVSHGVHPYGLEPGQGPLAPWSGLVGTGTPVGDKYADSRRQETVSCDVRQCHPSSDVPPVQIKDRNAWEYDPVQNADNGPVTLAGSPWYRRVVGAAYAGSADWTRATGASISTTFTGSTIAIRGSREPGAGAYCDVYIDGQKVDTFSAYSPSNLGFGFVWTSPKLFEGVHSLTVVHTGVRHPAATDNIMLVDAFFVYSSPGPFVYRCLDCHEEMARQHTR